MATATPPHDLIVAQGASLYSCPVVQHVVLHGDVSHTRVCWGADALMQWRGLGEAISFVTHQGRYILVDAGEEGSALDDKLRQSVDVLLFTHNDRDHVGGAPALLRSGLIRIREVWLPYDWYVLYSAGANLVDALRRSDTDLEGVARDARTQVSEAIAVLREHLVNQEPIVEVIDAPFLPRRLLGHLNELFASLESEAGAKVVGAAGNALHANWIGGATATAKGVTSDGSRRSRATRARATVRVVDAVLRWGGPTWWFSIDHTSAYMGPTDLPWELSGLRGEFTLVNALPVRVCPLPPPPMSCLKQAQTTIGG